MKLTPRICNKNTTKTTDPAGMRYYIENFRNIFINDWISETNNDKSLFWVINPWL